MGINYSSSSERLYGGNPLQQVSDRAGCRDTGSSTQREPDRQADLKHAVRVVPGRRRKRRGTAQHRFGLAVQQAMTRACGDPLRQQVAGAVDGKDEFDGSLLASLDGAFRVAFVPFQPVGNGSEVGAANALRATVRAP